MSTIFKSCTRATILLFCSMLFTGAVIQAQDNNTTTYPTLTALEQAHIPLVDPVALAKRLRGVGEIPPPPTSVPIRQVGDQQKFWVSNDEDNAEFQVTATLRVVGKHIYMWLENDTGVSDSDLQALADVFDNSIYDAVRNLWGSENTPGVDGDPHLYGLFAHGLGSDVAAYFVSRHIYPTQVYPTSNQHEMFFFNLDSIGEADIANPQVESVVAHEFQHMIRANIQDNDDLWVNEGFSTFTQLLLYNDPGASYAFMYTPQTQLNTWAEEPPRDAHYGAAMMFIDYFYERYGLDALRKLSVDPGTGLDAFDHVLKGMGEPGVDSLFADWSVANFVFNPNLDQGQYGYKNLPENLPHPPSIATVDSYPFSYNGQSNQYTNDYYTLKNLNGITSLDVTLEAPDSVQLFPANAASGQWMWYSNRGDMSDTTLTHKFDLSSVDHATLNYKTWYDIEDSWDYGYVMVSTDGGASWDILKTPHSSDSNPHGNAYGAGYTGESTNWVDESISLDAYAGKNIQVRFEMITDDGVDQPGMAIDDVAIPELNYSSDFESDPGGWRAEGWIRVDNRLPQQTWVQAIEFSGSDAHNVQVTRWLANGSDHWTLPVNEGVDQVILAVSPFAPTTTIPMDYSLRVEAS
jgi:immune inhibitor A